MFPRAFILLTLYSVCSLTLRNLWTSTRSSHLVQSFMDDESWLLWWSSGFSSKICFNTLCLVLNSKRWSTRKHHSCLASSCYNISAWWRLELEPYSFSIFTRIEATWLRFSPLYIFMSEHTFIHFIESKPMSHSLVNTQRSDNKVAEGGKTSWKRLQSPPLPVWWLAVRMWPEKTLDSGMVKKK